jgi:hypothetical protein
MLVPRPRRTSPALAVLGLLALPPAIPAAPVPPSAHISAGPPAVLGWDKGWAFHEFDVKAEKWQTWKGPAAPLPRIRGVSAVGPSHAAVLYPNARYGGWIFDRKKHTWAKVPASPIAGPTGVRDPIVAAFVGRKLFVWGLSRGDVHGAVYDVARKRWDRIPEAPVALRYRCLHGVIGDKVLVWGGYGAIAAGGGVIVGAENNQLQDGAVYDVTKKKWEKMPRAPIPYRYGMSAAVWQDRLVLFGGSKGQDGATYDPKKKRWEKIPPAPRSSWALSACAAGKDQLLVWSWNRGAKPGGAVYDFRAKKWEKLPQAPIPGRPLAQASIVGQRAFVWSGWNPDNSARRSLRDGAVFDLKEREWKELPPAPGDTPMALHPGW